MVKPQEKINIKEYAKTAGIALIILGVIHLLLAEILSSFWGIMLIVLGIIALVYRVKKIILIVGIALIFAGITNILASLTSISIFWTILGGCQIYWGIQEISRYKRINYNSKRAK